MTKNNAGRFARGNRGKPRGAKSRTARLFAHLDPEDAGELVRRAFNDAMKKDGPTRRAFLERLLPRERTIDVELPILTDGQSAVSALAAIVKDVANGKLAPSEGESLSTLVTGYARAHEVAALEARIAELERRAENK